MRWRALALLCATLTACPRARLATAEVLPLDQAPAALLEARAAFARRPDVAEVRRAMGLFLSAQHADPQSAEGAIGVIRTVGWLLEHGAKDDRKSLTATALDSGNQCQLRAPNTPACDYWQAVALGLSAREQPSKAMGELKAVIELLRHAKAAQPQLEDGGPSRVLALLLLRAPGWPLGPGDADLGLEEARLALSLAPTQPLNQLAVAEALAATGDTEGAKAAYEKAKAAGEQRAAANDPDGADVVAQARAALSRL